MRDPASSDRERQQAAPVPGVPDGASIDEIAAWLGLSEEPFATFTFVGMHGLRRMQEQEIDDGLRRATESLRRAGLAGVVSADPLRGLVDAVLANGGLGPFKHANRAVGQRLRRSIVRALRVVAEAQGLGWLRDRAGRLANEVQRLARPIPATARELITALAEAGAESGTGPANELEITAAGKPLLMLGGELLTLSKGGPRPFGPKSAEGRLLIALVRHRASSEAGAATVSRLRSALKASGSGVKLENCDGRLELSRHLALGKRLLQFLAR